MPFCRTKIRHYMKRYKASFHIPLITVQYLCKFLCNHKEKVTEFVSVQKSGGEVVKRSHLNVNYCEVNGKYFAFKSKFINH